MKTVVIKDLVLKQTCVACPESYDAFQGDVMVAYYRLRHGRFTVVVPDVGGKLVYEAFPEGDGIFEPAEREFYLNAATDAVLQHLKENHADCSS